MAGIKDLISHSIVYRDRTYVSDVSDFLVPMTAEGFKSEGLMNNWLPCQVDEHHPPAIITHWRDGHKTFVTVLNRVDLSGAKLGKTNFMGADLKESKFVQADCFLTQFNWANLAGCDWRDAKLDRASFGRSRWTIPNVAGMRGVFLMLKPSVFVDADGQESEVSAVEFMEAMNSAGADITAFGLED